MANLNDGVGKKIVEALKKQSEIEAAIPKRESNIPMEDIQTDDFGMSDTNTDFSGLLESDDEDTMENVDIALDFSDILSPQDEESGKVRHNATFNDFLAHNEKETDNVSMPGNIVILRKLISQLPSGVTRHTGAQIIKQTMEALGISMKSVLTEAQEVQNNLKESSKECQIMIQEYKRKISLLEKQTQNYQKQYNALNDLISLFIQATQ